MYFCDIVIICESKNKISFLLKDIEKQTLKPNHIEIVCNISPNGKARNIGAKKCSSNILFFFDQDVRLGNNDLLFKLCDTLIKNKNIGLAGASIKPNLNLNSFQKFFLPLTIRNNLPIFDKITESDIVTTQCCAIRKDFFNELNGFNEKLIRGVDPEFRNRIRKKQYKICISPNSYFFHPIPENFKTASKLFFRNGSASAFANKNYPDKIFDISLNYNETNFITRTNFKRKFDFIFNLIKNIFMFRLLKVYFNFVYMLGYIYEFIKLSKTRYTFI